MAFVLDIEAFDFTLNSFSAFPPPYIPTPLKLQVGRSRPSSVYGLFFNKGGVFKNRESEGF
jgi:hypothetical protein